MRDPVIAENSEARRVLKRAPNRSDFPDDADGLEEEAAALAIDALAFGVGRADVLARRASDDDIGEASEISQKSSCGKLSDIGIHPRVGMGGSEGGAAPLIDLTRGDGAIAGAMHAE